MPSINQVLLNNLSNLLPRYIYKDIWLNYCAKTYTKDKIEALEIKLWILSLIKQN